MIPEFVAPLAAGTFFGAAVYINVAEQPARLSCGGPTAVAQWRPSYRRGTLMQAPLALVGSLAAAAAWRLDGDVRWLVGGLLLFLAIPFTLIVIFPTNRQLESPELDLASEEAVRLLQRWGSLHAVRSMLGGFSFAVFLWTLVAAR
jgi:F0F1-type ATP synthase assembly protein I